jgi:2-haloacid dehalogenase
MSPQNKIEGIKASVFDAYGTLFDVHSAVGKHRDRLGEKAEQVSVLWRTKQLEYTWLRSLMKQHADFWKVTLDALDFSFDKDGIADKDLRDDLMNAYLSLDAYPEVSEVLRVLKERGFRLAILSNGTPAMLDAAIKNSGIENLIDVNLSIEDVGIFKPDPTVYQLAVDKLSVQSGEIIFQSSNAWDAAGASAFGFNVAWVNRFGQSKERLPGKPDFEIESLRELPDLIN